MRWGIVRRNDNQGLDPFFGDMERVFDDFFSPGKVLREDWLPRLDVEEDEKSIHVIAEMPGLNEKDINVTIEKNVLTIEGEKKEEREEKDDKKVMVSERRYGSFKRSFKLPDSIKGDEVKAEFKNGLLKIELPKSEESKPRKIDVQIH